MFEDFENTLKSMGKNSGAYRDINLSFINYKDDIYTVSDIYNLPIENQPEKEKLYNTETFNYTIAYLSSYLNKKGFIYDFVNSYRTQYDELLEILSNNEISTVIIPTTLYVFSVQLLEVIRTVRKHNSKAKIIVGGPYIYI